MKQNKELERGISDIAGVFTDPVIVCPGGWGDSPPARVKEAITLERLIMEMKATKGETATGTDAEAMWYLSTASLNAPLDSDWAEIYMYAFTQVYRRHKWGEIPSDLTVDKLDNYRMGKYLHFKHWIYDHHIRGRHDRDRAERREQKDQEQARQSAEQPALFKF